ncbi:T9SS type A sorting domain-containing protein [Flammeovirga sp. OC4]|uniref:T9SS type A sorting domain-containing protein n=1 Tax=Flammeovirga sp. OC4 TaxID=1382345 RepID=UPI0009E65292|nr:T9SS type A sorting domain-containing protein [Flammeovirga sp. OC4]
MRSKLLLLLYFILVSSFVKAQEFSHGVPIEQYEALLDFYDSLNGDNWKSNDNWKSDLDVSEWEGIKLEYFLGESGETYLGVSEIILNFNNLRGHVPSSIANIKTLQSLNLQTNYILSIPQSIYSIEGMYSLRLSRNRITDLPKMEAGQWAYLRYLDLFENLLSFEDFDNLDLSAVKDHEEIKMYSIYDDFNEERALFATYDPVQKNVTLSSNIGGENTEYKWYKNGELMDLDTESITYNYEENKGDEYYCELVNSDYEVAYKTQIHKQRVPYKITLTSDVNLENLLDPYFYISGPFENPFVRMEKTENGYECWVEPFFDNFDIVVMYFKDDYRREVSEFLEVNAYSSTFSTDAFQWLNSNHYKLNVPPLELRAWDDLRANTGGGLESSLGREYLNDNFKAKDIYGHEYIRTEKIDFYYSISYLVIGDYIKYFNHLKEIDLAALVIGDVDTESFQRLEKLEKISIYYSSFKNNSDMKIPAVPTLKSLILNKTDGAGFLRNNLSKLEQLETLMIKESKIDEIVGSLPSTLSSVKIIDSQVGNFSFLENAESLLELFLVGLNLSEIPEEVCTLRQLTNLDVSNNALDFKDYDFFVEKMKDINPYVFITMKNQEKLKESISYQFDYDSLHLIATIDPKYANEETTIYQWSSAGSWYYNATTDTNSVRIPFDVVKSGFDLRVTLNHKNNHTLKLLTEDEEMLIPKVTIGLPANHFIADKPSVRLVGDFEQEVVTGKFDEKTNHYYFQFSSVQVTDTYKFVEYVDQNTIREEVDDEGKVFDRFLVKSGLVSNDTIYIAPIKGWSNHSIIVGDLLLPTYNRLKRLYEHFNLSQYKVFDSWFIEKDLNDWTALEFKDFEGGDGRLYKDVYGIGDNSFREDQDYFHGKLPSFIADFKRLHHLHMSYQSITDISPAITHQLSSYQIKLSFCKIKPETFKRIYDENKELSFFGAINFFGQRGNMEDYEIHYDISDTTFVYSVNDQLLIDDEYFSSYWNYNENENLSTITKDNSNIGESISFTVHHKSSNNYRYMLPRMQHEGIIKTIILPRQETDPDTLLAEGIINGGVVPVEYDAENDNWFFTIPEYIKQAEIVLVTRKDDQASYEFNELGTPNIRVIDLTVQDDNIYLSPLQSFSEFISTDYMPVLEYNYCKKLLEELGRDDLEELFAYSYHDFYISRNEGYINDRKYLFMSKIDDEKGDLKSIPEGIKYCVKLKEIESRYSRLKEIPPLFETYNELEEVDFYFNKLTFYHLNKLNKKHALSPIKKLNLTNDSFELIQVGDTVKLKEEYMHDPKTIFRWNIYINSNLRMVETATPYIIIDQLEKAEELRYMVSLKMLNEDYISIQLRSNQLYLENDIVNSLEEQWAMSSPYPNPFKDQISLDYQFETIEIYTINGQLVYTGGKQKTINLSHLKSGVYLLKAKNNTMAKQYKIIKK